MFLSISPDKMHCIGMHCTYKCMFVHVYALHALICIDIRHLIKIRHQPDQPGTHAEGSMVGSLEFCTGKLGSRLILVLGHTKCGAIYGATKTFLDAQAQAQEPKKAGSALEGLLKDLGSVAQEAAGELGPGASSDEVAAHAVKVNVFHSMNFLLKFSDSIREAVKSGQVQLQGGIYHLETGKVEFLGKSPVQSELLSSTASIPPSMTSMVERESRGLHGVRTAADERVPSDAALKMLKDSQIPRVFGNVWSGEV